MTKRRISTWTSSSTNGTDPEPSVFITKNKQRLKQHKNRVYLKDQDEFELELFNPTIKNQLAKIKLNGKSIGGSGIVIKPGERVFLERFLDTNKKFKFTTYEVGVSNEIENAIRSNGDVEVDFYDENIPTPKSFLLNDDYYPKWNHIYYGNNTGDYQQQHFYNTNISGTICSGGIVPSSVHSGTGNLRSSQPIPNNKKETGTIERGSTSSQEFISVDMDFNLYVSHSVKWKILPISQKVYTSETVNKTYCTECGSRIKKSTFKFCPNCGNRLT